MDESQWELVAQERRSLARMLEQLDDQQWQTQSLCTEWTVHQVFAHLVMTPMRTPTARGVTVALAKARGHVWHMGRDVAVAYAREHPPEELLAMFREVEASRGKPWFVMAPNILPDLVVHGQDMAVPLGIERPVPDAAAEVALERLYSMGWPFHASRRLRGIHVVAESSEGDGVVWEAGEGPELRGGAGALALLMTERRAAALARLHGPGLDQLQPA